MPIWPGGSWFLTIEFEGLPCRYHLRSASGSSGPIAKEKSPLLGWRPILILGAFLTLFFGHFPTLSVQRVSSTYVVAAEN